MRIGASNGIGTNSYDEYRSRLLAETQTGIEDDGKILDKEEIRNAAANAVHELSLETREEDYSNRTVDISDLMNGLKNITDFESIGRNSRLENLDKPAEVDSLKRDSILKKYEYFVGSVDSSETNDDGNFFKKTGLM